MFVAIFNYNVWFFISPTNPPIKPTRENYTSIFKAKLIETDYWDDCDVQDSDLDDVEFFSIIEDCYDELILLHWAYRDTECSSEQEVIILCDFIKNALKYMGRQIG